MADEKALRGVLLATLVALLGAMQADENAANVHWAASDDNEAIGCLISGLSSTGYVVQAFIDYFTGTMTPTDLDILLAWLRAANKQVSLYQNGN